jgi:6-phosphogluconolactonase
MSALSIPEPVSSSLFHRFLNRDVLAEQLAVDVAVQLREAVRRRGAASIVLSGGGTPAPFLAALGKQSLPWEKITVMLADERCVPTDHPDSNERMIREALGHTGMRFVALGDLPPLLAGEGRGGGVNTVSGSNTPYLTSPRKQGEGLSSPFDVVVLGMGEDGHTASLFPHHPALADTSGARVLHITDSPKPPAERVTLSPSALLSSRWIVLHITGDTKRKLYEAALKEGSVAELPIRCVLHQSEVPVSTYWAL